MSYEPRPIDTSHIALPEGLAELTECLAMNAHENWARQRMNDGWVYGPQRDDQAKHHPDLVPYAELSDREKEYDRLLAMETVKAICAIGYTISKSDD